MAYAESTSVAFEKSIAEIIGLVRKHGAEQIGQMEMPETFTIGFKLSDRLIRFNLPLPRLDEMPTHDGRRNTLTAAQRNEKRAQAMRQRGRALLLVIKAKLESVESGIETLEQAFLANVVMANGQTVYERIKDNIAIEYQGGKVTALLPAP